MAKPNSKDVAFAVERRLSRTALLRSTALQGAVALALVTPAAAQPAPNAHPTGGSVVAGSATIGNTATTTTINQSTNRAAINWQSFDVGSNQTVTFQQPNSTSVTLNRVNNGDPSAIAGKIDANGQLIITNPSGVTFYRGSEINAQSVIVSAAGISNKNFMAGKMVFDHQAKPGAQIANAGTITVKQAGLAALVAPSVANSGVINAKLGQVVLAGGATAHTLDMYGDGLVSIDVTKQVQQAPAPNGQTVTALVTNTGTIRADGGVVQLTAQAADGVVQTLVDAGGKISANSAAGKTGRIEIAGIGGSVTVRGQLSANGLAAGSSGGQIAIAGSDTTTLAPTARVSASGRSGGGTVAVGTTLARAAGGTGTPAGTSAQTVVASGAAVSANGRGSGNGGRVTVLSTQQTTIAGKLTAKGGRSGGNGGAVEMSGAGDFALTGTADVTAAKGAAGSILLDPYNLTIVAGSGGTITPTSSGVSSGAGNTANGSSDTVGAAAIAGLSGNITLSALNNLTVSAPLIMGAGATSLTLSAVTNVAVNAAVSVPAGALTLSASSGTINVGAGLTATSIALNAATGISLGAALNAGTGTVALTSPGGAITQTAAGPITAGTLNATATQIGLTASNLIGALGTVQTTGTLAITNAQALQIAGAVGGQNTTFAITGALTEGPSGSFTTNTLSGNASSVALTNAGNGVISLGGFTTTGAFSLTTGSAAAGGQAIQVTGPLSASSVQLTAYGGLLVAGNISATSGPVTLSAPANGAAAATLQQQSGTVSGSAITLSAGDGIILSGGSLTATASFGATTGGSLSLVGANITAPSITLTANSATAPGGMAEPGLINQPTGTLSTPLLNASAATTASLASATNNITVLGSVTAPQGFTLATSGALSVNSPVSIPSGYLSLSAGGAGALTVSATLSANGITLEGGSGGIALGANVVSSAGEGVVSFSTSGPITQTAGGIAASFLTTANFDVDTASSIALTSRTNTFGRAAGLSTSTGGITLVTSVPFTAGESDYGGLTVPTGQTIALVADSITLVAGMNAAGGTFAVSPYTAGLPVQLITAGTAKPANTLALDTTDLSYVNAATLQLGLPDPATGRLPSSAITLAADGTKLDLGTLDFTTLNVQTSGALGQVGDLAVTTLTGQAGSLTLTNVGNFMPNLAGVSTTSGDLLFHTGSGLTVSGTVSANGGTGTVSLSSTQQVLNGDAGVTDNGRPVAMLLTGIIQAGTLRLDSSNGDTLQSSGGISQTAGTITAATLTDSGIADAVTGANFLNLNQGGNSISALGPYATYGGLTLSTMTPLQVAGAVTVQATTAAAVSLGAAGITQTAAGTITTPELDGTSSATTALTNRANAIASIGYFTQSAGDFALTTSSPTLFFGGNAGTVTAENGSLTFVADNVGLVANPAGSLSAPNGLITFAPYTASRRIEIIGASAPDANSLSLSQAFLNRITAFERLGLGNGQTTGPINVADAGETVTIPANASLQFQTTGNVTEGVSPGAQNGGGTLSLIAADVSGSAGNITLAAPANQINAAGAGTLAASALSSLSASGSITLATQTFLSLSNTVTANATSGQITVTAGAGMNAVGGPLTASGISLTANGGNLLIQEAITTGGTINTVALNSTGTIDGTAATITTGTLSASGSSITLTQPNNIGALGTVSTPGALSLTNNGSLQITGGVSGQTVSLNVAGALTESDTGSLSAGTLTGSAYSVALPNTSNLIGTLGSFTALADFVLTSGAVGQDSVGSGSGIAPLNVAGPVSGSSVLITGDDFITVAGPITATAGSVTLSAPAQQFATNTIAQTGGAVTGSAISYTAADGITLTGGSITGTTSASFTTGGTLSLPGTGVTAPAITLTATTARAPDGTAETGSISQTAGTLSTAQLTGSSSTTASFTSTSNNIAGLGSFSSNGGFSLITGGALTLNGPVTDATSVTLAPSGALTFAGNISTGTLTLNVGGAITQPGGNLTATTLTGSATSATISRPGNSIANLGAFTTTGLFSLADASNLAVTGAVATGTGSSILLSDDAPSLAGGSLSAPSGIVELYEYTAGHGLTIGGGGTAPVTAATLQLGLPTGGPVTINQALDLPNVGTLSLQSAGVISEGAAGSITVGSLTGSGASASLGGANAIGTLTAFTTTGAFALTDTTALAIRGTVTTASTALNVTGALTEPTGSLVTGTLTGSASSVSLTAPANAIGSLGPFNTAGAFSLTDGTGLTVSGAIDPTVMTLTVAGPLTVNAPISATTLDLQVTGAVTEGSSGALFATTLEGKATSAALTGSNYVGTLAGFTTQAGFTLNDAEALTVTGPVTDPTSVALAAQGSLTVSGAVGAPLVSLTASTPAGASGPIGPSNIVQTAGGITAPTQLSLSASGAVSQTGGTITVGTLTGSSTGTTSLNTAGNEVGTLAAYTSSGGFALTTGGALTVAGPVSDPTATTLSPAGVLTLNGTLSTGTLTLNAGGMITQPGGTVTAATLAGSGAGVALTAPGNSVGTLGAFSSTGAFTLSDAAAVTVTGVVSAASGSTLTLRDDSPAFNGGSLSAPGGTVVIAEYTAGNGVTIGGGAGGITSLPVTAATLQLGVPTGGPVTIEQPVSVSGTLSLQSAGAIAETQAGAITAGTLTGSGASANLVVGYPVYANAIGTLGSFSTTGAFTLTNGGAGASASMTVAGPVTGSSVSITDAGSMTLAGSIAAPTVTLQVQSVTPVEAPYSNPATITQSTGAITGNAITITSVDALTQAAGASIAGTGTVSLVTNGMLSLGGADSAPALTLTATTLTAARPSGTVTETGTITQTAGAITTAGLTGSSASTASLAQPGNAVTGLGGFSSNGGFTLATAGALTVTGPLADPVSVSLQAASLALAGNVSSTAGVINLNSAGSLTQPSGVLTAATLTGSAGVAALTGANQIATLDAFRTTAGTFTVADAQPLAIAAAVSVPTGQTLTVADGAPSFAAGGSLSAPGGTVVLTEYTPGAGLTVGGGGISSSPPVTAATLQLGSLTGGPLAINGTLDVPNVTTVSLRSGGAISEGASGAVIASTLTAQGSSIALGGGGNAVSVLGAITTPGSFSLTNGAPTTSVPLTLSGVVSAASVQVANYGPLVLANNITAPAITLAATGTTAPDAAQPNVFNGTILQTAGAMSGSTIGLTATDGIVQASGAITATTNATLSTGGSLTLNGGVAAPTLSLTATSRTAAVTGGATPYAVEPGTITLGGTGSGVAVSVSATDGLTLGGTLTATGSTTLSTGGSLTLAGALTAPAVTLTATTQTALLPTGATQAETGLIAQTSGVITAAQLSGSSASSVSLPQAGNAIAALGPFTAPGTFLLTDGTALTVNGAIDPTVMTLSVNGPLAIMAPITAGTLNLQVTGAVTESGSGLIAAGVLEGSAASAALTDMNFVGTLAGFATQSGFSLTNGEALTVTGPVTDGTAVVLSSAGPLTLSGGVSAPAITLVATTGSSDEAPTLPGTITQTAGAIAATGTLSLTAAGSVGQTGGTITAGTLTGSSGGTTTVTEAGNGVGTIGAYSSVGGFTLTDSAALTVSGPLADSTSVALTAPSLTLAGTVQTGALQLAIAGAATQTAGAVTAASLTGSAGSLVLGGANSIAAVGPFATSGNLALSDSAAVTIAGAVTAGPGSTLTITDNAPSFGAGGSLAAPGGTVVLQEFTPGSGITLGGGSGLSGTAPVTAATLTIGSASAGPVTVAGQFNLSSVGTLNLLSAGAIAETGQGAVAIPQLVGNGASLSFGGANAIGTLGAFTTTGGLSLNNGQALTVAGPLAASAITLSSTGALTLAGNAAATVVTLTAPSISQTGGALTAATLAGSVSGTASFGSSGNAVATLGSFSAGTLSLADGSRLTVNGPVAVSNGLTLAAPSLAFGGTVQAGTLTLAVPGAVTQGGGAVTAAGLTGSAGSLALVGANAIGAIGPLAVSGSLSLSDAAPLTIAGAVSVGTGQTLTLTDNAPIFASGGSLAAPGGAVALREFTPGAGITLGGGNGLSGTPAVTATTLSVGTPTGGPLTINGAFALPTTALDLESAGTITETGSGSVSTPVLTGSASSASLGGNNRVNVLGGFATVGGFALTNGQSLSIAGPLTASAAAFAVTGDLALTGFINAPASLSLTATGTITQAAGSSILTGSLAGSATAASLVSGSNNIGALAGFTTVGDFTLTDAGNLTVSAPVDPNTVTFDIGGNLFILSSITAGNIALNVDGTMTEGGAGVLNTANLTGAAQAVTLTGNNQVTGLGNLQAAGSLTFADTGPLAIIGSAAAGQAVNISTTGALTATGQVGGGAVTLAGATITQASGGINGTNALTLTSPGAISQTGGSLSAGTAQTFTLNAGGPVTLGGSTQAGTLSVSTPASLTQTGGSITAKVLTGSATGAVSLGTAGAAAIGTVSNMSTGGTLSVADTQPLTLSGALSAPTFTISAPGQITLAGGTIATSGSTAPGSTIQVTPTADGTALLTQTGDVTVHSLGGGLSALTLSVPSNGGAIAFTTFNAPSTDVVLGLGTSGTATGTINTNNLLVEGSGGSAMLTGSVRGETRFDAALISRITPAVDPQYTLNGCEIAAASCVPSEQTLTTVAAAIIASTTRPDILVLDVLDLSVTRDRDDPTLTLPNISNRDY